MNNIQKKQYVWVGADTTKNERTMIIIIKRIPTGKGHFIKEKKKAYQI